MLHSEGPPHFLVFSGGLEHFIGIVLVVIVERQEGISDSFLVLVSSAHVLLSLHGHGFFFGPASLLFLNGGGGT